MIPVAAFYCQLCKVFLGDVSSGTDHFKCESHYLNYKVNNQQVVYTDDHVTQFVFVRCSVGFYRVLLNVNDYYKTDTIVPCKPL